MSKHPEFPSTIEGEQGPDIVTGDQIRSAGKCMLGFYGEMEEKEPDASWTARKTAIIGFLFMLGYDHESL